jgi:HYR domain
VANYTKLDTILPVITCPASATIYANASCVATTPNFLPTTTVTDNCNTVTTSQNPIVGATIATIGVSTVTITATDGSGNIKICTVSLTVLDTIKPTIICPTAVSVFADANSCNATNVVLPTPTVTDNCGTTSITNNAPSSFSVGVTTYTYTVTDANSNTKTCTNSVTVIDNQAPIITCPANKSINTTLGLCSGTAINLNAIATDNCAIQKVTYTISGATTIASATTGINNASTVVFNKGISTVTYVATDVNGNSSTCNFTVTVNDTENPTIVCPANVSQNLVSGCTKIISNIAPISFTDNCSGATLSYTINGATATSGYGTANGTSFNLGISTVVYTVTDANSNATTCSFTVTISDTIVPIITCPASQTLILDAINCNGTVPIYTAIVSDNCIGIVTQTQNPIAGAAVSGTGTFIVTITATDANGNTATCNVVVTKVDNTAPILTCPATQTLALNATCNALLPDYTSLASAIDNCSATSAIVVTQSPSAGTIISTTGTTTLTITASDASGNTTTCTFGVNKIDTIAPTIICPASQTIYVNNSCVAAIPNLLTATTTTDGCGSVTTIQNPAPATTTTTLGASTITITATDASGNTKTCTVSITVLDTIKPTIICPAIINVNANAGTCVATNIIIPTPTVIDNCAATIITNNAPTTFAIGSTTYTYTVTDASGNATTCTNIVVVTDNQNPAITCPTNKTVNADAGLCTATIPNLAPTFADNCGINSITYLVSGATTATGVNDASGVAFAIGTSTVIYTVTDVNGNVNTCSFSVIVADNQLPTFACPANITIGANTNCQAVVNNIGLTNILDNCANITITYAISGATTSIGSIDASGTAFALGTSTIVYTVTDASSNSNTCSVTITVTDKFKWWMQ